jgi:hypothetical protein
MAENMVPESEANSILQAAVDTHSAEVERLKVRIAIGESALIVATRHLFDACVTLGISKRLEDPNE